MLFFEDDFNDLLLEMPQDVALKHVHLSASEIERAAQFTRDYYNEHWGSCFDGNKVLIEPMLYNYCKHMGFETTEEFGHPKSCIHCPTSDRIYGRTDWTEKKVYINHHESVKEVTVRQTSAHELFHVLQHTDFVTKHGTNDWPKELETNASSFARALLMPRDRFIVSAQKLLDEVGLENGFSATTLDIPNIKLVIEVLAHEYEVPGFSAAIRFGKDLNILGDRVKAEAWLLAQKPKYIPRKKLLNIFDNCTNPF